MSIRSASAAGCMLRGVALVAEAQVGGERVGADLGPLGGAAAGALALVGDEVDLHVGVRRDDGADVAALDHDVALVAELALALAHHLAHLAGGARRPAPSGRSGLSRIEEVTSVPAIETRPPSSKLDRVRGGQGGRAVGRRRAATPRLIASQVRARYIAPVSR